MALPHIYRPKKPGATMRVWEIADELEEELGREPTRSEVIERVMAEGGNLNTASTQHYHWKTARATERERTALRPRSGIGQSMRFAVAGDGALRLPRQVMKALNVSRGGTLVGRIVEGELCLMESRAAVERARKVVRDFDIGRGSPVDELIAERRREASG